jgi:hypothetical protein
MVDSQTTVALKQPEPDDTVEDITVYHAAPASGQFQARRTKLRLANHSDGISVSKLRVEWLRSQGLPDAPEEPD